MFCKSIHQEIKNILIHVFNELHITYFYFITMKLHFTYSTDSISNIHLHTCNLLLSTMLN